MIKILALIPTLKDDPTETIYSLLNQTKQIMRIYIIIGDYNNYKNTIFNSLYYDRNNNLYIIFHNANLNEPLGKRISEALNFGLRNINLKDYDYVLRVDSDTILPKDFIEKSLRLDVSIIGRAGFCMFIKVKDFIEVFNGKFPEVASEDSYITYSFMSNGYKSVPCPTNIITKGNRKHSWRYYYDLGTSRFRCGYEPFHALYTPFIYFFLSGYHKTWYMQIFAILGYFVMLFKREKKFPFYKWVFKAQLNKFRGKSIYA